MFALILSAALGQWSPQPPGMLQYDPGAQCQRTGGRCFLNRSGNRPRENYAFFEFAPSSGAGMGTACACTTPTSAKGDALTFTRTAAATCSPLGLATTGITNASLVECSANLPRVESSGSVLGLRVEGARTNVLTRFIDYANATWADVATPTLTGAQVSPWTGTYANLAVQFDDNNAAAFEGRTQTVTVTAATAYVMSCYVKAGTLAAWTLSLDGTTASGTGLSSTTWSRVTVTDASSSGVAIAAQALNGSVVGDTGTVIWGGCQVEAGTYATSMIPTVAAGVARGAEAASFLSISTTPRCAAGSFSVPYTIVDASRRIANPTNAGGTSQLDLFVSTGSAAVAGFAFDGVDFRQPVTANLISAAPTVNRAYFYYVPSTTAAVALNGGIEAVLAGGAVDPVTTDRVGIGVYVPGAAGTELNGIVSLVQVDPSPSRCR